MQLKDFVDFQREYFFDGAVQLKWIESDPEKASLAAQNYVFHGPKFHSSDMESVEKYSLKDTLSFTRDILVNLYKTKSDTAFHLTIAGYGMGKSHLAAALAMLLMNYPSPESTLILDNMSKIDQNLTIEIETFLKIENRPFLILVFDGMGNFNLPSEFRKKAVQQIQKAGLDLRPIDDLSPRFQKAQEFVKLNYQDRQNLFEAVFGIVPPLEKLLQRLIERDEITFEKVNEVFSNCTGSEIPLEGQDSVQELLVTIEKEYCGPEKPFAKMLILFDEFGRFLEYAADNPRIAGDYALQQIYQGVQDTATNINFVGFIQYDLKTYLNRIRKAGQGEISRYIGRFDAAQKHMLSSNLETIFANLLHKPDVDIVRNLLNQNKPYFQQQHQLMKKFLPRFDSFSTWSDFNSFYEKILLGSWPLDPITVWLLTKEQNIVQNRSAISFIKDKLDDTSSKEITENPLSYLISPADFCAGSMLEEMKAAEESAGGTIVQSFYSVKEKHASRFSRQQINVLAGIVIAHKLKTLRHDESSFQELLAMLAGISLAETRQTIRELSDDYNVLEWNSKLAQYDILIDSVPRSAFTNFLKVQAKKVTDPQALDLFQDLGLSVFQEIDVFQTIEPDFADDHKIFSKEWVFTISCVSHGHISRALEKNFSLWSAATQPGVEKGQLIHYLLPGFVDEEKALEETKELYQKQLALTGEKAVPVLVQIIADTDDQIIPELKKLYILRNLRLEHKEKYRNFIESESELVISEITSALKTAIRRGHRVGIPAGVEPERRIKKLANQIFATIYPKAVSFPFDGFHTTKGNALKDCYTFTKAILNGVISLDWLRNEATPRQNRFKTVLIKEWGLFSDQLDLNIRPKSQSLSKIVTEFEEDLKKKSEIQINELYRKLLKPPYGFNDAQASLLLAYFLVKGNPSKSIIYEKRDIAKNEWSEKALPEKLKFFDTNILKKTKALYISENIQQEWQQFFMQVELAESHTEVLDLFANVESLKIKAPLPAELDAKFKLKYIERLEPSKAALAQYENDFGKWRDQVFSIQKKNRMDELVYLCDKIRKSLVQMEKEGSAWTEQQYQSLEDFNTTLVQSLAQGYKSWLEEERFANKLDFGKRNDHYHRMSQMLSQLKLIEQSKATTAFLERCSKNLDAIEAQQHLVKDVERFIAIEKVQKTTTDLDINTQLDRIKEFRVLLNRSALHYDSSQIKAMGKALDQREKELKAHYATLNKRMEVLFGLELDSVDMLKDTLRELDVLSQLLRAESNVEDLKRMREQLSSLLVETNEWSYLTGAASVMKIKLSERIKMFLESESQNPASQDFVWSSEEILTTFQTKQLEQVQEKAQRWKSDNLPSEGNLTILSISESNQMITRLKEKLPDYLDSDTLLEIDQLIASLREHIDAKTREENDKRIRDWLEQHYYSTQEIQTWSMQQAKQALNKLAHPPEYIPLSDVDQLHTLILEIQSHLETLKEKASQQAAEDWLTTFLPEPDECQDWNLQQLKQALNKSEDPPVDYPEQFYVILEARIPILKQKIIENTESERKSKVKTWMKKYSPEISAIKRMNSAECVKTMSWFTQLPDFFVNEDKVQVSKYIDILLERKEQALKEERLAQINAWKLRHLPEDALDLESLNAAKCKEALALLKNLPDYLREVDYQQIEAIKRKIEIRLDTLDFQLLFERVQNLNIKHKKLLLESLSQELSSNEQI